MTDGLPVLPDIEMALVVAPRVGKAIRTLRDALRASFGKPDGGSRRPKAGPAVGD